MSGFREEPFLKEESIRYDRETGRMLSTPRQIFLELSSRCNLQCVHCSKDFGSPYGQPERDMPMGMIRRLEPWLQDAESINLNMVGESLLSPEFDAIVARACSGSARVHFNTNGLLMTDERCRHVVEHGVYSVGFSIDGLASNWAVRGVPYSAIRKRMVALSDEKRRRNATLPLIGVAFTLMRRNLGELYDLLVDLLPACDVQAIHLQPLVVFYETLRNENVYESVAAVDELVARCRALCVAYGTSLTLFRSRFEEDERHRDREAASVPQLGAYSTTFGCTDPFYEIKVRSTGDVMSCSYGRLPGLNLWRHGLDDVWNGPWYRTLRRQLFEKRFAGKCAGCPFIFGSRDSQLSSFQSGVHHSRAERFLEGYDDELLSALRTSQAPPETDGTASAVWRTAKRGAEWCRKRWRPRATHRRYPWPSDVS